MPIRLYPRQRQIRDFIFQYIQKNGYSPTLPEIAEAMEVKSLSTIHEHLKALAKKNVVRIYKGAVRGIEIIDQTMSNQSLVNIELYIAGFIAAGEPIEAIEDPQETINVSSNMLSGKKRAFVLQVRGDSMIEEGILDGDFVVVEEQNTAENGDIVVALFNNGFATLKKFFKEKSRIRLEPANAKMASIYVQDVAIQGKVCGVVRRY